MIQAFSRLIIISSDLFMARSFYFICLSHFKLLVGFFEFGSIFSFILDKFELSNYLSFYDQIKSFQALDSS